MAGAPARRLPLLAVIRDAFALPWKHRTELFRAASLPMLALIAVSLLWEIIPWGNGFLAQWIPHLFYLLVLSWLAVVVHRLVLLEDSGAGGHFDLRFWKRVGVYVLAFATLAIMFLAAKFLLFNGVGVVTGILYVPTGEAPNLAARNWLHWGTSIVALLAVARFVMVLPSIAIDRGHELGEAWRISRGQTWRLAVIYGLLPWSMGWLIWLLNRDGSSNLEYAVLMVISCLLSVVEIVALSLSFGALTAPEPPPTDPRA